MFSTIDTLLILKAQWLVRKIELFTKFTRDDIASKSFFLLQISFFTSTALLIFIFVSAGSRYISQIPFGIIVVLLDVRRIKLLKEDYINQKSGTFLPKEILVRAKLRKFSLLMLILLFLALNRLFLNLSDDFMEQALVSWFSSVTVFLFLTTSAEYFLCTTSLPPDEKSEGSKKEK